MSRRGLLALVLSLAFAVGAVVPGAAAAFDPGATTTTEQFLYVGESAQDWTVPEGVTSVWLEVEGAAGGDGGLGGGAGGSGYGLAGEFATEPGRVLLVYVGGEGKEGATVGSPLGGAGGWPGGGEGGEGSESFFGTAPAVMQGGSGGGGGPRPATAGPVVGCSAPSAATGRSRREAGAATRRSKKVAPPVTRPASMGASRKAAADPPACRPAVAAGVGGGAAARAAASSTPARPVAAGAAPMPRPTSPA
ncbi:MAG: hypothetical protein J0H06_10900 [Actinobacteria bacterium]|nr:hypothetical protein [Actinomycetota bacterium]